MRLAELQAAVHAVLRHDDDVATSAARLGVPESRLTIYRDFVTGHVTRVIGKVYPYVQALSAPDVWERLTLAFYHEVPARERELNACVQGFPEWLAERGARDGLPPCAATLAQVEWELFAAWSSEVEVPDPATLAEPIVNPTLAALETRWAIVPWMVANPDAALVSPTTPPPAELVQVALVFRRALHHRVAYYVASDDLLFALKIVSERITPRDAAALAGVSLAEVEAALARAAEVGLVLGPQGPPEISR